MPMYHAHASIVYIQSGDIVSISSVQIVYTGRKRTICCSTLSGFSVTVLFPFRACHACLARPPLGPDLSGYSQNTLSLSCPWKFDGKWPSMSSCLCACAWMCLLCGWVRGCVSKQECGCQPCSFPVEDNFFEAAGDLFSLEPLAGIILFTRVSLLLTCSFRSTRERRLFSIDVKSIVVHIEQCRWTTTGTFVCGSCVSNDAGMVASLGPLQTWRNEQGSQKGQWSGMCHSATSAQAIASIINKAHQTQTLWSLELVCRHASRRADTPEHGNQLFPCLGIRNPPFDGCAVCWSSECVMSPEGVCASFCTLGGSACPLGPRLPQATAGPKR